MYHIPQSNSSTNTSASSNRPSWMEDPLVQSISKKKLDWLESLFHESQGKSQKNLLAALLPKLKQAKTENLMLTPPEMQAAIQAIKNHSTAEELAKIENLLKKGI